MKTKTLEVIGGLVFAVAFVACLFWMTKGLEAMNRRHAEAWEQRNRLRYSGWQKMSGSTNGLTYEEWRALR